MTGEHAQTRRWWRAPFTHFVFLGGALFALDATVLDRRTDPAPDAAAIRVTAEHVAELKAALKNGPGPANDTELKAAIDAFVDDEIMVREARKLGLHRGDLIIRRRLVQKMSFVVDDMAAATPPTDAEMNAWLADNRARYQPPTRFTIEHVYFAAERRGARASVDAAAALEAWRTHATPPQGDPFLAGSRLRNRSMRQLQQAFGPGFAATVTATASDISAADWQGPAQSTFGHHLFRVIARSTSDPPTLDTVRERVRADVIDARRRAAAGQARAALRERYSVSIEQAR